jgi:23S rRNA pseudouridine1911/1915/1917 synthase
MTNDETPNEGILMQEWVVSAVDAGMRLDLWLVRCAEGGSRRRVAEWLARGKVYLNGEPVDLAAAAHRLVAGEGVGVWLDRPGSSTAADRSIVTKRHLLRLVYSDAAIIVVDKPPGLLVDPLPDGRTAEVTVFDLLRDQVRREARTGLYVVHRIDRDTSGLVLLARTAAASEVLKDQFEAQAPERVYQAVLLGCPVPTSGTWRDRLSWDASTFRQRRAHGTDARAKEAVAQYAVREQFAAAARVEVSLVTGKRNQIRVQAALRGHPLLGEHQYRFDAPHEPAGMPAMGRHALHAWRLGFVHPLTAQRVSFTAPLPDDLERLLCELRGESPASAGNGGVAAP